MHPSPDPIIQQPALSTIKRTNLRTPEVMAAVAEQVGKHYRSELVEAARAAGGVLEHGRFRIRLAKEFGFCYGVERAIDLAYAATQVYKDRNIYITGEIIHNPDVNEQIAAMGIRSLVKPDGGLRLDLLQPGDVVIFPAFGAEVSTVEAVRAKGCEIVDTTCGDVMSVWKRVKQNAAEGVTSVIHGKVGHEETRATASRAIGAGSGHYVIVRDLRQTDVLCRQIRNESTREEFFYEFRGALSEGFDPALHLKRVGVANQTTMLRSETEEVQRRVREAIIQRDGNDANFRFFDTICGATQDRQDALFDLLMRKPDLLIVVGGYNSSNTTHLVEIGEKKMPTFFIRDHHRLLSPERIRHFDIHQKCEVETEGWLPEGFAEIGLTAGASCPSILIEQVVQRLFSFA